MAEYPITLRTIFVITFDKPFTNEAAVADGNIKEGSTEATVDHAGAIIGFTLKRGEQVHARIMVFKSSAKNKLNRI